MLQSSGPSWVVHPVVDLTKIDLLVAPEDRRLIARILWPARVDQRSRKLLCHAPEVFSMLREAVLAHDANVDFDWDGARKLIQGLQDG